MLRDVQTRSGFVLRMLSLLALACALLFTSLVILDNEELHKVIPPSPFRSLAIFFGYMVALISFNYISAARGKNFMGWKVEGAIALGFLFVFAGFYFPFAFALETEIVSGGVAGLFQSAETETAPDWQYLWLAVLAVPAFAFAFWKLLSMPLWKESL